MKLKDWIRSARKAAGLTQEQLGERLGLTKGNVSAWENARHEPSFAQLQQISEISGMALPETEHNSASSDKSKRSHLTGMIEGSHLPVGATLTGQDLPNPNPEEHVLVPLLDIEAACGEGRFHDHVVVDGGKIFRKDELRDLGVPEHAGRLIYAAGGSMSPTIQDGRAVLINLLDREPRDGKIYAICTPSDGLVLKRLIWDFHPGVGQQTWIIRSDNPDRTAFPDKLLPPDDRTMIVGRARWTDSLL